MSNQLAAPLDGDQQRVVSEVVRLSSSALPTIIVASGAQAGIRFLEFFASTIRNPHTRRAYARAVSDFLTWCGAAEVLSISGVQPLHVAS